jgi:peptide/nickel transport system permease protein
LFARTLNWLPASGRASPEIAYALPVHSHIALVDAAWSGQWSAFGDLFRHLILPATTLGVVFSGVFLRMTRVNLLVTLRSGYVEAARARGVPEGTVVRRHALKNAMVPLVTVIGLQVALLLSGAVLTERTFDWPGLGSQLVNYLNARDYTAVQGIITFYAVVVVIVSVVVDALVAWLDPRVRYR